MSADDFLVEQGEAVNTRADFVQFLGLLRDDFNRHGADWENRTLDTYLEAMRAWSSNCDSHYRNTASDVNPDEPQWRVFADMLLAARVYE